MISDTAEVLVLLRRGKGPKLGKDFLGWVCLMIGDKAALIGIDVLLGSDRQHCDLAFLAGRMQCVRRKVVAPGG